MSTPASTLHQLLAQAKKENTPQEVAEQLIVAACMEAVHRSPSRMELYSAGQDFSPAELERIRVLFEALLDRYRKGEPLQYITGVQVFLDHEYQVTPAVLIPRPETEVLVTTAISMLERDPPRLGLELGIGSGILSIELLSRFQDLTMMGSERSSRAIPVAARNAVRILGAEGQADIRLSILLAREGEVWEPFEQALGGKKADFLVSNPPYLADASETEGRVSLTEPAQALFAPSGDPLFFYREMARRLRDFVRPGGYAFFEIPHERASEIANVVKKESGCDRIRLVQDLTGRERVLTVEL